MLITQPTRWLPALLKELPKVDGKVFIITGTTSGTGFVAAKVAAEKGGEVVLLNRPSQRVATMMDNLKEQVPQGKFVAIDCDLQDFSSVRKAAAEVKDKYSKIYCLANNAGIMATPDRATIDGYDIQMQTNHLSHFLLISELYPLLKATAEESGDARIVNHSSLARHLTPNHIGLQRRNFEKNGGNLGGDLLQYRKGPCYDRYSQTKLANSVLTIGLNKKLQEKNSKVRVVSAHPGVSSTNLIGGLDFGFFQTLHLYITGLFKFQTAEDGTMGLLKGMMHPDAESGVLYGPELGTASGVAVPNPPQSYETDPKAFEMLWETSQTATGVTFQV